MSFLRKTPITIITGFLGSGKTTLISKLIETYKTGRLAIIVNEFGDTFSLPNVELFASQMISLPIYPLLEDSEISYICDTFNRIYKKLA